ncbi:MAG: hypothetical protein QNJ09_00280 [Paracoccaceae bacterium]|nr:hypothetical protein [Paracoccaceae bacterium]
MNRKTRGIDVQAELLPDGSFSPKLIAFLKQAQSEMNAQAVDFKQPPWRAVPDYERHSMGWRMGPGEDYSLAFDSWLKGLSPAEFQEFVSQHPEPEGWEGFYKSIRV